MRPSHTALPFLFALLAFILASLFGAAAAFAQCVATPFAGGEGTSDTPYQISSIAHLNAIRDNSGDDPPGCNYLAKHFVLKKDLDFLDTDGDGADYVYSTADDAENAKGWVPIGHDTDKNADDFQGTHFTGTFDGGGHVILNLLISRPDEDYMGIFGSLATGSTLKNLGVAGQDISGDGIVGGIVGALAGAINSCYSTGAVTGNGNVGGLVGRSTGRITSCYATGAVTGGAGSTLVGGLVGENYAFITSCYVTGAVTGGTGSTLVGGFVGRNGGGAISTSFWENANWATTDDTTDVTAGDLKSFNEGNFGARASDWVTGADTQYPALKHGGSLICGQPSPRAYCEPPVRIASATAVTEGGTAMFTLTREAITLEFEALTVTVSVTGGAGFIGTPLPNVMFAADSREATYSVPTEGDTMDEADGRITVTITDATTDYSVEQGQGSATAEVMDDDLPVVSITAVTSPVTEGPGAVASFTVSRPAWDVSGALVVDFTVDQGVGDFIEDDPVPTSVEIGDGAVSEVLTFQVDNDVVDEADGMITVTLSSKTSVYTLSSSAFVAMVEIADDDPILVSITGTATAEGAGAVFTLMRGRAEVMPLAVKVTVDDGAGDFLTDPLVVTEGASTTTLALVPGSSDSVTVTIAADQDSQTFTVSTDDDTTDEADGTLTATITAEAAGPYRVHDTDADVLMASVEVDIADNDLPLVSIAAGTSPVTEGTDAEFTLTRVGVTTEALTAPVSVTDPDGFLSGVTTTEAVFGVGEATVTLILTTDDDEVDEADGMVTVTVTEAVTSYRVDADNSSATVTVTDDDDPPPGTALSFLGTISDQTYTQNTAVTALVLPEATGGTGPYTYTLTPVPAGLMFDDDPASRTLSGMPTATTDTATTHTYMVTDSTTTALTKTLTFTITVNAEGTLSFSGTIANQTYTKNTAITDLVLPVATGGMGPYRYTLVPVPAGLMFDATTRTLSGMPTAVTPTPTTHTYTVTDTTADTALTESMTFTITVNEEGSPTFADTIANQTYTENTVITDLVLPVATGGMGSLTYALTPVPDGLEFDATNRTLSGTPTIPTPTPTTHTYTVTDTTPVTALTAALTFTITVSEEAETTFGIGSQAAAVHVYPNPAGDVLHIEFPGAGDYGIALLTVTGQQVFGGQHAGGGTKKLDVGGLVGGVYFLKIEDSEGVSNTFRIIL